MNIIIVTGLSGAGKTQAMDVLEDIDFYCVDNLPPVLIRSFIDLALKTSEIKNVAFGIDVRGRKLFDDLVDTLDTLRNEEIDFKMLYLEATDKVLARRYNETRRNHPMAQGDSVSKGIKRERKKLEPIRSKADYIIDTSGMNNSQLAAEINNMINAEGDSRIFTVNIMSFGYKNGMPASADMTFDARFIPNPYYVKSLKNMTGNDAKVQEYVMEHDIAKLFMDEVVQTIETLIPYYKNEGKFSLSVCFGCTGGQHRSVTLANVLNRRLADDGIRTTIGHRDLQK